MKRLFRRKIKGLRNIIVVLFLFISSYFNPSNKRKMLIFNSLERRKKQNINYIRDKQNTILANL